MLPLTFHFFAVVCRFPCSAVFSCFDIRFLDWVVTLKKSQINRSSLFPTPYSPGDIQLCCPELFISYTWASWRSGWFAGTHSNEMLFGHERPRELHAVPGRLVLWLVGSQRTLIAPGRGVSPRLASSLVKGSLFSAHAFGEELSGPGHWVDGRAALDLHELFPCMWESELVVSLVEKFSTCSARVCLEWIGITSPKTEDWRTQKPCGRVARVTWPGTEYHVARDAREGWLWARRDFTVLS